MTMRRSRIVFNILLTLAAIGLAVGLWLAHSPAPPPALPTLSSIVPNHIDHITVRHASELIELERRGPDRPWRLVSPIKALPDPTQVATLLTLARTQATHAYPLQAIADRTTGLSKTPLTVRFNDAAPIRLGAAGPEPGSRYVATAHRLLLARLPDTHSLTRSWSHWIDPALVAPNTRLTRLVLPDFTLTRDDAGLWQASPIHQRSGAAAQATISAWKRVKALTVVPADRSRQRIARITMDFADAPPRHLDVIESHPNLILRDPRLQVDYHLAGNRVPPLLELQHPRISDDSPAKDEKQSVRK